MRAGAESPAAAGCPSPLLGAEDRTEEAVDSLAGPDSGIRAGHRAATEPATSARTIRPGPSPMAGRTAAFASSLPDDVLMPPSRWHFKTRIGRFGASTKSPCLPPGIRMHPCSCVVLLNRFRLRHDEIR